MTRVLVTGATGNVGREVVAVADRAGLQVTAGVRGNPFVPNSSLVHAVRFDFLDRRTWADATRNQDHIFLVRPPAIADVENNLNPFVDFARDAGVDHFVFLSVAGADKNRFVPHRKVEDHLRERDVHHTNLRPGFFAQNLQSAYLKDIRDDDRIYVPAGSKPVNWIDVRDLAEVAVRIFQSPEAHRNTSYTLAGPGPVPWSIVTAALSTALDRPIRYEPASVLGYVRHLSRRGLPGGAIAVQTILHFLLRFGQGATEDPTLERLLGRPPRSIETYIADHAHMWERSPQTTTGME